MVIAYRYTGEETAHLRRIFTSYDVDNSGTVEVDELRDAFALHDKYTADEIDQIFLAVVRSLSLRYWMRTTRIVSNVRFYPQCFSLGYEWLRKDIMD